jgi:hypothetical protein
MSLNVTILGLTPSHFVPNEELYNNTGSEIIVTAFTLISNDTYKALLDDQSKGNGPSYTFNKIDIQRGNYTFYYEIENTFTLQNGDSKMLGGPV